MTKKQELSTREQEIVSLSEKGLTNDAIAYHLHISVGTVNTYWLRIKLKVGGIGKTDTVAILVKERAEKALKEAEIERALFVEMIAEKEETIVEMRSSAALLKLAAEHMKTTVWSTDSDLTIKTMISGHEPIPEDGKSWEVGKTIQEIFQSSGDNLGISAHLAAFQDMETGVNLTGEFDGMYLRVVPLKEEDGTIIGTMAIIYTLNPSALFDDPHFTHEDYQRICPD